MPNQGIAEGTRKISFQVTELIGLFLDAYIAHRIRRKRSAIPALSAVPHKARSPALFTAVLTVHGFQESVSLKASLSGINETFVSPPMPSILDLACLTVMKVRIASLVARTHRWRFSDSDSSFVIPALPCRFPKEEPTS